MVAADLSPKLLNFRNLNPNHLPQVGQFVYLPDKIIHKNIGSLTRALGRVEKITDRSVTIRMSSGRLVSRNCQDIVTFQISSNLESNLDILDIPLYGNVSHEILTLNASQFEGASLYIPTISENDDLHSKNLEIPDNSDTN